MRKHLSVLTMIVIVGYCPPADAQAGCAELARLRGVAAEAMKQTTGVPTSDRCVAYIRFSMAWADIVGYARNHRELCGISYVSLSELEKHYREAATARDNVCAGRPLRAFPPDVV